MIVMKPSSFLQTSVSLHPMFKPLSFFLLLNVDALFSETKATPPYAEGHDNDVNAVAWADDASQVLFSGSDDCTCKVW